MQLVYSAAPANWAIEGEDSSMSFIAISVIGKIWMITDIKFIVTPKIILDRKLLYPLEYYNPLGWGL